MIGHHRPRRLRSGHRPAMTIAVAAHIGGFIPGLLLAIPLLKFRYRKA